MNVWVVNATTGAMRRITDCPSGPTATCGPPAKFVEVPWFQLQWSPNGQKIFFIRWGVPQGGEEPVPSLGTVRADGSDQWELPVPRSESPSAPWLPVAAQWSPDGRELAVDTDNGVWIVDAAGTVTRLTSVSALGGSAWSPDGRQLAIVAPDGTYTIDADGKTLTRLPVPAERGPAAQATSTPSLSAAPWSPNGKQVAGSTTNARQVEWVWTINADGSNRRLIYKTFPLVNGGVINAPLWSPDGKQFAFSSDDGIYVANANGSDVHRIGQGSRPPLAWQPIPSTR
jgi:Tol biopolymer transport system component